jgi:hypothetical protein
MYACQPDRIKLLQAGTGLSAIAGEPLLELRNLLLDLLDCWRGEYASQYQGEMQTQNKKLMRKALSELQRIGMTGYTYDDSIKKHDLCAQATYATISQHSSKQDAPCE